MNVKLIEIRDRNTFIPALAVLTQSDDPNEVYLLSRCGYNMNQPLVLLTRLEGRDVCNCDGYDWGDRTWQTVHLYLETNWELIKSGDVVDVEFILYETATPKQSEKLEL